MDNYNVLGMTDASDGTGRRSMSGGGGSSGGAKSATAVAAAHLMSAAGGGTAVKTASLGDRDMMTYMPPGGSNGGSPAGSDTGVSGGNRDSRELQHAQAQHPELPPSDDAVLTAMSADLMDLFGDGTKGLLSPLTATTAATALVAPGAPPAELQNPLFGGVGMTTATSAAAASGPSTAKVVKTRGMPSVSDSSCSGRSSLSGGKQRQHGAAAVAMAAAAAAGGAGQIQRTNTNSWSAPLGCSELSWRLHGGAVGENQLSQKQQQQQQQQQQQAMGALFPSQFVTTQPPAQQNAASAASTLQQQLYGGGLNATAAATTPSVAGTMSTLSTPAQPTSVTTKLSGTKRRRKSDNALEQQQFVSEDESDRIKRRRDRNAREQQRSHQITAQINHLRDVLTEANVQFKPDKYSTLVGVADYIKSLQSRKALLDAEHSKLLDTIRKTSGVLEADKAPSPQHSHRHHHQHHHHRRHHKTTSSSSSPCHSLINGSDGDQSAGSSRRDVAIIPNTVGISTASSITAGASSNPDEDLMVFVRGLDYKNIFSACGIALGIAAVDGRLVDCNDEFVVLSGRNRDDLLGGPNGCGQKMSLFNLLGREGMEDVFRAMSLMLRSEPLGESSGNSSSSADDSSPTAASSSTSFSPPGLRGMHAQHVSFAESSSGQILYQREGSGPSDHWSGIVTQGGGKNHRMRLNITLVRSSDGRPKFFNCALSPHEGEQDSET